MKKNHISTLFIAILIVLAIVGFFFLNNNLGKEGFRFGNKQNTINKVIKHIQKSSVKANSALDKYISKQENMKKYGNLWKTVNTAANSGDKAANALLKKANQKK